LSEIVLSLKEVKLQITT